jgi:XTP/dITP diphosphohydrolase
MELLVATRNEGKLREIEALLAGRHVSLLSLREFPNAPEVVEDGDTLQANAVKKAVQTAQACGVAAVADDSGLFVDALGGRPGVHSARYAGPGATCADLCTKLLGQMQDVPDDARAAHFACCIVLAAPDGRIVLTAEGRCDGIITKQTSGGQGFGYDPVFYHPGLGKTFAEAAPEEKNAVSHRGRALAEFLRLLPAGLPSSC